MANTLFIVEDALISNLPKVVRDKTMDEVKKLLSFIPKYQVVMRQPAQFPATIDFTDAIVKIVETDGEIGAVHNEAMKRQLRNIEHSIRARNIDPKMAPFQRATATPESGGVGWNRKEVTTDAHKLAITQTGGVASIQFVRGVVLQEFAPNKWTMEDAKNRRTGALAKARLGRDEKLDTEKANKAYEASEKHWRILNDSLASWPKPYQEAIGIALGRLVAHEARHQYIVDHYEFGGLGGDGADMYGNPKTSEFLKDDQSLILNEIVTLEKNQKTATIQIETLPKGQAFPF